MKKYYLYFAILVIFALFLVTVHQEYKQHIAYWLADSELPDKEYNLLLGTSSVKRLGDIELCQQNNWLNRGFYNADIRDVKTYIRFNPLKLANTIVIYAGENHLTHYQNVEQTIDYYQHLLSVITQKYPAAKIQIIGIKPSPARKSIWHQYQQLNHWLATFSAQSDNIHFYNNWPDNLNGLFLTDGVHLSQSGYARFFPLEELFC